MADAPNDPKADLKSRLALRTRAAAPAAQPVVPGAPLPPKPEPVKAKPQISDETIAEARRRAAEVESEAGPSLEAFQIGAQENTPLPGLLPSGPEIQIVEVGEEEGANKKKIITLVVAAGLAAVAGYFLGSGSGYNKAAHEQVVRTVRDAQDVQKRLGELQPIISKITAFKDELARAEKLVADFDPTKDVLTIEEELTAFVAKVNEFVQAKPIIEVSRLVPTTGINYTALSSQAYAFAHATNGFYEQARLALEEIQSLLAATPIPAEDRQQMLLIAETETQQVEGLGEVPLSKGTQVLQTGRPERNPNTPADSPTFLQLVKVEGRNDPVTINTTQLVRLDMKPFYADMQKSSKRYALLRLTMIINRMTDAGKQIQPKQIRDTLTELLSSETARSLGEAPAAAAEEAPAAPAPAE